MTNKNQEHIQLLTENFFNHGREAILSQIMDGTFNIDDYVESNEEILRKELNQHWETLVGTGNPYWERESITESDLKFIIGRLKHDLCLKLPDIIKRELKEKYQDWQSQYLDNLMQLKDITVNLCQKKNVGSSRELMKLQTIALSLQNLSSLIEKVRLYFTAQQLKIDPVAIPVLTFPADLEAKATRENETEKGICEIAAAASVLPSASESEALMEAASTDKETKLSTSSAYKAEISEDGNEIGTVHIFERALVNGFVNTVKHKPALVPEKFIREKGFEHGDELRVINVRAVGDKMHYDFELAKKVGLPAPNRIQINFCIVERDDAGYFVQRADSGQSKIIVDGTEWKIYLKEHDAERLKITEGDIIDIAFRPFNTETARVVWKHYI